MIFAVIVIQIINPNFLRPSSLINILSQTAAYLPLALGIAGCIVLTGTDLSAGRCVGLTACISASLLQAVTTSNKMWPEIGTLPIPVVILIAMAIGAAVGVFNGFFVAKFKLHPFIVTLGTQLILYSCLLLYVKMGNNGGMAISGLDKSYNDFIKGSIISVPTGNGTSTPIPNYVWFAILLAAVMWFIWNKTTFGKNMFALGSNEEAARVSGVNVLMTTVLVFALAGAMYGWTGFCGGRPRGLQHRQHRPELRAGRHRRLRHRRRLLRGRHRQDPRHRDRRAAAPADLRGPEHGQRQPGPDLSGQGRHHPVRLRPGYAQVSGQEIIAPDF